MTIENESDAIAALDSVLGYGTWSHEDAKQVLEFLDQGLQGLFTADEVLQKIANLTSGNFYRADGTVQVEPAKPTPRLDFVNHRGE